MRIQESYPKAAIATTFGRWFRPTKHLSKILTCILAALCIAAYPSVAAENGPPAKLSYTLLDEADHDPRLFTQGLLLQDTDLVETSGGYGQSLVRRYDARTGKVKAERRLGPRLFAEGVAQTEEHLWVLTWRENLALKLDPDTFAVLEKQDYPGEGWGLAFDGERLVMSNGSDKLIFRHPDNFTKLGTVSVHAYADTEGHARRRAWANLNELEYAQGLIWANVWQDSRILAIDPKTGIVRGVLDLQPLVALNNHRPGHSVLNGIAYDPGEEAFWVTGKLWPKRYKIRVHWPQSAHHAGGTAQSSDVSQPEIESNRQ